MYDFFGEKSPRQADPVHPAPVHERLVGVGEGSCGGTGCDGAGLCRSACSPEGGAGTDQGGCDVEVRAWGEGTGPLLYTATLTAKNGRKVNGMGYTPEGAEEDAMKCWMRGEG